ncbi:MAG: metallophosphatase [Bacteroidaceae bacterium]|nr:metallophosphatase [Bacteroidaceae bacterium]
MRCAALVILAALCAAASARAPKRLVIIHTNDTHSRIEPFDKNDGNKDQADKGGYVRRAAFIDSIRNSGAATLVVDCGDFSQGTPYYNIFKGDVEIDLMNSIGYEACTIGNHEFDFGMENMLRLFKRAKFPVVCANYDFTGTMLEGVVKPYTIVRKNGLKIGIIGLGPIMEGLVFEKNYHGIKYMDPIGITNRYAELLKKKKKCDLVVVISHLGFEMEPGNPCDKRLVPEISNVDIVLGGHTHTYLAEPVWIADKTGKKVPVSQMGKNGRFVGTMTVEFAK